MGPKGLVAKAERPPAQACELCASRSQTLRAGATELFATAALVCPLCSGRFPPLQHQLSVKDKGDFLVSPQTSQGPAPTAVSLLSSRPPGTRHSQLRGVQRKRDCLWWPREETARPVEASGSQVTVQKPGRGRTMASATSSKKMREEATCSICLNLMTEPMSISCGHSYCQACILRFLDNQPRPPQALAQVSPCPQCRAPFQRTSLRPNKQLGGLIEALREMDCDVSCEEHDERLQLFCEDEGQLICWRCERAPQHRGHSTALVEDVCPAYKEKLQNVVTKLRQLEEECMNQKAFRRKQITEWNEKISIKRQKIHSDFKNLHSFLEEEEKSYLWRLEREKEQTLRRLRDSEAKLGQKRHQLESHILELEERCQGSAQRLLKDVKATLSRSQAVQLEAPEALSLEVRTVCDVPKLYFDVKKLLRSCQVSVVLDPDTAHRELIVSEDQRQVTRGCPQDNLDMSPRRFTTSPCILGRESFTSGRHYFEVDVGEGTGWDIGVCVESVQRDTGLKQEPQAGFWALRLCAKDGYVALTWPRTPLHLGEQPLVVGVLLDCEAGVVAFYSVTSGSHIFTFPKASFSDALRPYFQVYPYSPLFLPPPDV